MNIAIILAAGKSKRFGQLKQFTMLDGKPVIFYSIQKFNNYTNVDRIIIVTTKSKILYVNQLIKKYHLNKVTNIISGGTKRQDSVNNAIKLLPTKGYVAIHDAARPLFSARLLKQGFKYVKKYRACIPVIPVQDTVKEIKSKEVNRTINRSDLYYVQTPQFFEVKLLKKAYTKAYQDNFYATDDANLVEKLGIKVYAFEGDKFNIKITDQQDLYIIKSIM